MVSDLSVEDTPETRAGDRTSGSVSVAVGASSRRGWTPATASGVDVWERTSLPAIHLSEDELNDGFALDSHDWWTDD